MDRWELYTAGKIPKPTESLQLSRVVSHGDFVIEAIEAIEAIDPPEGGDPDVSANDTVPGEGSNRGRRWEKERQKERIWNETCDPGKPPMRSLQAAACGFILGVAATLLAFFVITRTS